MSRINESIQDMYRHHFSSFIGFAFHELYPGRVFQPNWHLEVLADYLYRCSTGEIKRLIINLPPRSMKSLSASIAYPAWILGRFPDHRILSICGDRKLADTLESDMRKLLSSPRFQHLFPHLKAFQSTRGIRTPQGGFRTALSVGDAMQGMGADLIIVDDPISPEHARDPVRLRAQTQWFDDNLRQRLDCPDEGCIIVIQQRLHAEDLSGHLLSLKDGRWTHLCLPAIASENEQFDLTFPKKTLGRKKYEALHPERQNIDQLRALLQEIGPYAFWAQYQQSPLEQYNEDGTRVVFLTCHPPDIPWRPDYGMPPLPLALRLEEMKLALFEIFGEKFLKIPISHHPNPGHLSREEFRIAQEATQERMARFNRLGVEPLGAAQGNESGNSPISVFDYYLQDLKRKLMEAGSYDLAKLVPISWLNNGPT